MKSSTEIYTRIIKELQDFNQELRLRHASMPFVTVQETRNSLQSLEEELKKHEELESISLIIYQHLNLLKIKLQEQLQENT